MKKQWSLFRFCVCSEEKLGFCDMKGDCMRKMKIALLLVALFAFSSELFAYDFDSLETTYSKEVYDKR